MLKSNLVETIEYDVVIKDLTSFVLISKPF